MDRTIRLALKRLNAGLLERLIIRVNLTANAKANALRKNLYPSNRKLFQIIAISACRGKLLDTGF
jgi:hypothetical protein